MPRRVWRLRIEDILDAIERIHEYTAGIDFPQFAGDRMRIDAVVRNFEIIGEASRYVPTEVQDRYPDVPWLDMRDMRNFVAHAYFRVDTSVVWDAVQRNLPPLVPLLREILEKEH